MWATRYCAVRDKILGLNEVWVIILCLLAIGFVSKEPRGGDHRKKLTVVHSLFNSCALFMLTVNSS